MGRHRGRRIDLRGLWVVAVAVTLLFSGCGSSDGDQPSDAVGADDLGSEAVGTDGSDESPDGAAEDADAETENEVVTQDGGDLGTEISNDGAVGTNLILPGEPGFLEALGVAGVRVTRTTEQSTEVTEFDRSGTAHGLVTYSNDEVREAWLSDGEIYELKDGQSLPRMYGVGLVRGDDADIGLFFKEELLAMLVPGDEVTDAEGNPRREHRADPDQLLAFHIANSPEQWEWRSAELFAITNPAGGLVRLEHRQEFLLVPAPNMVDPPPPREEVRTEIIEVEPFNEPVVFPADGPHPDSDDHLVTEILRLAESTYDGALADRVLNGSTDPITVERLQQGAEINDSPILRFIDGFADFEAADERTIGFAPDGILIMQGESGKWFCIAGRLSLAEQARWEINDDGSFGDKLYLEASGDVPDDVAFDCRQQRTDFIGATG